MSIPTPVRGSLHSGTTGKPGFNADTVAIALALLLAGLVRLNVLPSIGW